MKKIAIGVGSKTNLNSANIPTVTRSIYKNRSKASMGVRTERRSKIVKSIFEGVKGYILPLTLLVFAGLMLAFPSHYLDSARKGLATFSSSVLPAIFPFAFLSNLMAKTSIIDDISRAFEKPVKKLFGVSKEGAFVLFSSLICGYPVGSATIEQLHASGAISDEDAKSFVPFSSTASPIFVLATVGGALFENVTIGCLILISHYVGTLLNGVLWRFVAKSRERRNHIVKDGNLTISVPKTHIVSSRTREHNACEGVASVCTRNPSAGASNMGVGGCFNNKENIVGDAMVRATSSMLAVGGYIVLFGLVVDTLNLIPKFALLPFEVKSVVSALIEMSRGVAEARFVQARWLGAALATFAITFGGVSVNLQNYHYLSRCNCTLKDVILPKISQGILAFLVAIIFSIFFFNIFGIKG